MVDDMCVVLGGCVYVAYDVDGDMSCVRHVATYVLADAMLTNGCALFPPHIGTSPCRTSHHSPTPTRSSTLPQTHPKTS